jgi:hypothetical protein
MGEPWGTNKTELGVVITHTVGAGVLNEGLVFSSHCSKLLNIEVMVVLVATLHPEMLFKQVRLSNQLL